MALGVGRFCEKMREAREGVRRDKFVERNGAKIIDVAPCCKMQLPMSNSSFV